MRKDAAFWTCAAITVVSALTSAGFSLAALLSSTGDARVIAMYSVSRSVALALVAVACLALRLRQGALVMAALMVIVQVGDTAVGLRLDDMQKTAGPALLAIATALAFEWLRRQPTPAVDQGEMG